MAKLRILPNEKKIKSNFNKSFLSPVARWCAQITSAQPLRVLLLLPNHQPFCLSPAGSSPTLVRKVPARLQSVFWSICLSDTGPIFHWARDSFNRNNRDLVPRGGKLTRFLAPSSSLKTHLPKHPTTLHAHILVILFSYSKPACERWLSEIYIYICQFQYMANNLCIPSSHLSTVL